MKEVAETSHDCYTKKQKSMLGKHTCKTALKISKNVSAVLLGRPHVELVLRNSRKKVVQAASLNKFCLSLLENVSGLRAES